jgi:mono/diheme cytochrome c family protein
MNRLVVAVGALVALLGFSNIAMAQGASARGQKVFADSKCSLCHSIAGKGNPKGPLDEVGSKLTAEEMKAWIVEPVKMAEKAKATRKPVMKAFTGMPAADLDALVAYLQTLKKK